MMESLTNEIYEEGLKVINEVRPGVYDPKKHSDSTPGYFPCF